MFIITKYHSKNSNEIKIRIVDSQSFYIWKREKTILLSCGSESLHKALLIKDSLEWLIRNNKTVDNIIKH